MDFVRNLEMTHIVRGGVGFMLFASLLCIMYVHRYGTHPLYLNTFVAIEKLEPYNND